MRIAVALAAIALALPTAAHATCEAFVEWKGTTYVGHATDAPVVAGRTLGPYEIPPCNDFVIVGPDGETLEQDEEPPIRVMLARVRGVPPSRALAVVGEPHTIYIRERTATAATRQPTRGSDVRPAAPPARSAARGSQARAIGAAAAAVLAASAFVVWRRRRHSVHDAPSSVNAGGS